MGDCYTTCPSCRKTLLLPGGQYHVELDSDGSFLIKPPPEAMTRLVAILGKLDPHTSVDEAAKKLEKSDPDAAAFLIKWSGVVVALGGGIGSLADGGLKVLHLLHALSGQPGPPMRPVTDEAVVVEATPANADGSDLMCVDNQRTPSETQQ